MKKVYLFIVFGMLLANVKAQWGSPSGGGSQTINPTPDEETPFAAFADSLRAFPNPFIDSAFITFSIAATDSVTLQVFDITGNPVAVFFQDTVMASDSYTVILKGDSLQAGVYIIKLKLSAGKTLTKQLVKMSQVSGITSISNQQSTFSISPNPATNTVTISIDESMIGSTVTITDVTGRGIAAVQLSTQHSTLSTSNFPTGMYLITLTGTGGASATKKLVISH